MDATKRFIVPPALSMQSAAPAVLLQVPVGPAPSWWNQGSLQWEVQEKHFDNMDLWWPQWWALPQGCISECRANLGAVSSCDPVLYKPSRAGTCQANGCWNWLQLTQILLFFCCTGGLFPAMLLLLFTYPGDSSSLWNTSQAPHPRQSLFSYRPERAISTQNSSKRPLKLLASPRARLGEVFAGRGNTLGFQGSKPQNLLVIYLWEETREIFHVPPNKPLPWLDSNNSKTLQGGEAFPHPL